MLQCVAKCKCALQLVRSEAVCVVLYRSVLQCVAVCCSELQCVACVAVCYSWCLAKSSNTMSVLLQCALQCVILCCSFVLQLVLCEGYRHHERPIVVYVAVCVCVGV